MSRRALASLASAPFVLALVLASAPGCKKKVSQAQCETLFERYGELAGREQNKEAAPEVIKAAQERESRDAHSHELFRNCTTVIAQPDFDCAMKAESSATLLKCLE